MSESFVVVMHRYREHLLGVLLADDIVIQHLADFLRGRHAIAGFHKMGLVLLTDDVHAKFDAFIANEHGRARNKLAYLVLRLAAERAIERVLRVA